MRQSAVDRKNARRGIVEAEPSFRVQEAIDTGLHWYAVRCNIKCEEKAARNLRDAGFAVYLPYCRHERWNKRRNTFRLIEKPLIIRYLFVGLHPLRRHFGFVRSCEGVERILGDMDNHPIPIAASILDEMCKSENDLDFDETRAAKKRRGETLDNRFPTGMQVFVKRLRSVLSDCDGKLTVIKTDGKDKVQLDMKALGKPWVKADEIIAA